MIRAHHFRAGSPPGPIGEEEWATIRHDGDSLLWLDLEAPDEAELEKVAQVLELDPRGMAIVERTNRRPVVRVYPDYLLMTVLALDIDESASTAAAGLVEIDVFVAQNVLVTVHARPVPFAPELEARTGSNPELGRFHAAYLLYVLLDTLLDHYGQQFEVIETRAEQLEDRLLREPGWEVLEEVSRTKRRIRALRRLLAPHREALTTLTAPDSPISFLPDVDVVPFRDLVDRLDGVLQRLDQAREIAGSSHELYLSNMSHRTNEQLKVLTFLSAVLLPMTLIVGMFGTNFKLAEYDAVEPFYVMLGSMVLLAIGMLWFFRAKRWL